MVACVGGSDENWEKEKLKINLSWSHGSSLGMETRRLPG
jgi:hypothetical protein